MHKKLIAGLGAAALSMTLALGMAAPAQAAPPPTTSEQELATVNPAQITQTFTSATGVLSTFTGTFTPTDFTSRGGSLTVEGVLNGTVTQAGAVVATITNQATSTTVLDALAAPACDVLNLDLGPLHLDVLGLVVDLSDVQLDITAVPGAGNLLGNLLCAVAGLLDGPGSGLGNLLNRLLGL